MNKTSMNTWLSRILCTVLIAVMALLTTGCSDTDTGAVETGADTNTTDTSTGSANKTEAATHTETSDITVKGEGATVFYFHVVNGEGSETKFEIRTDKTIVGDALLELGLIAGDEESYGLYVKTVNGITADYDTDGVYWAFYEGDTYAMTGVDMTEITPGATYTFKIAK